MSHYDQEDNITETLDIKLALYQESRAVVKDGSDLAERLLGEAEPLMAALYDAAKNAGAADLMATVNDAWGKTQQLAKAIGQQDAALNGADATIAAIKESREAILKELDILKNGLKELDAEAHPLLEQFRNTIEAEAVESAAYDYLMFADDPAFDIEVIIDRVYESLEPLVEQMEGFNRINLKQCCESLVEILFGDDGWNDEQGNLLMRLLKSLQKEPKRAAIETASDYEEDGDNG